MKNQLIGLVLIVALASYPLIQLQAQSAPEQERQPLPANFHAPTSVFDPSGPKPDFTLIEACIAVGIIGTLVVIYVGTCIYNHVGNGESTPPQWTNTPPPIGPPPPTGTNDDPIWTNPPIATLNCSGPIDLVRIDAMRFADTNGPAGCIFTNAFAARLVAGDSPRTLSPLYQVRAWLSGTGRLVEWSDTNGQPLMTVYARWGETPMVPLSIGTGREPARFYALLPQ